MATEYAQSQQNKVEELSDTDSMPDAEAQFDFSQYRRILELDPIYNDDDVALHKENRRFNRFIQSFMDNIHEIFQKSNLELFLEETINFFEMKGRRELDVLVKSARKENFHGLDILDFWKKTEYLSKLKYHQSKRKADLCRFVLCFMFVNTSSFLVNIK
jgi:hypothetical protein